MVRKVENKFLTPGCFRLASGCSWAGGGVLPGPEGESCGFLCAGHALSLLMGIWGSSQSEEEAMQACCIHQDRRRPRCGGRCGAVAPQSSTRSPSLAPGLRAFGVCAEVRRKEGRRHHDNHRRPPAQACQGRAGRRALTEIASCLRSPRPGPVRSLHSIGGKSASGDPAPRARAALDLCADRVLSLTECHRVRPLLKGEGGPWTRQPLCGRCSKWPRSALCPVLCFAELPVQENKKGPLVHMG